MKYIDADRLREEIERRLDELNPKTGMFGDRPLRAVNPKTFPRESELEKVLHLIDSLQQEQPEFPTTDEEVEKFLATAPNVELPKKYENTDWLFKKQEQPEVDLEQYINERVAEIFPEQDNDFLTEEDLRKVIRKTARHFYELGFNARLEK